MEPRRALRLCLLHANVLLVVGAGALLMSGARLIWDPSAYVPLRELWPCEYRVALVAVPAAGSALLLQAHVAAAAASAASGASCRALLATYLWAAGALCCAAGAWAAWMGLRLSAWWRSEPGEAVRRGVRVGERLDALLQELAELHPLAARALQVAREAQADAADLARVAAVAVALMLTLQLAALALATAALVLERRAARERSDGSAPSQSRLIKR